MIMFREEIVTLEEWARQQEQIYDDACDIGIRIDDNQNEQARTAIRNMIKIMRPDVLEKARSWGYGNGKSWRFFIPIERERELIWGTQIDISWHKDTTRKVEFLTIDMHRTSREVGEI